MVSGEKRITESRPAYAMSSAGLFSPPSMDSHGLREEPAVWEGEEKGPVMAPSFPCTNVGQGLLVSFFYLLQPISQIGKKLYLLENKLCCLSWHFLESPCPLLYFHFHNLLPQTGLVSGSATCRRTSTSQGNFSVLSSCCSIPYLSGSQIAPN